MIKFDFQSEELTLLGEKAIYWKKHDLLLIADLHLGKVNHFRRSGIAVPQKANDQNMDRLISLLQSITPAKVIFMGDLFHSHYNQEWEVFGQVIKAFPHITFELVIGNHDILSNYQYEKHNLKMHEQPLAIAPFVISHEPLDDFTGYNLAGHIHPAVGLKGKGKQGMRLPCFFFGERQGLLPAFGEFTGLHKLKPKNTDLVFVIVEDEVVAL